MTAPKTETGNHENRTAVELDRCYGRIGISAVAAALAYRSEAKNPASEPGDTQR
jgi:hypothetical protein